MKKLDKQTASYIELALKFYTEEHKERIKEIKTKGYQPIWTTEFFDYRLADSLRELDRVTRKK
tara:strand:+ start:897 stop:1085 length:189 start_codon:yes stop_codon:yes gene_type:complete